MGLFTLMLTLGVFIAVDGICPVRGSRSSHADHLH
ncbi:hypothetical protein SKA58_07318 [Sphingomonas sp. SKA58]|nr:hypothetical protein SKA58_07318 [Sphingomonas sp. SKA58]